MDNLPENAYWVEMLNGNVFLTFQILEDGPWLRMTGGLARIHQDESGELNPISFHPEALRNEARVRLENVALIYEFERKPTSGTEEEREKPEGTERPEGTDNNS